VQRMVPPPTTEDEKGSRCKSGAIPVAVSFRRYEFKRLCKKTTGPYGAGKVQRNKPEDLPS
jgi:hypothetical protein